MVQAIKGGTKLLRVGVVGVGVMGSNHARVLAGLSGIELVGVADPDRRQRDLVNRALGCPAVVDVDALLKLGVDAVTIAAPTHLHHDIALTCIARGVHVLVEKPIASSVEEGRDIIAAARRAGVTLMVGHVERFNPAVQTIKDAIRGEDILSIAITRVGPFPPRMSNVGVVIDLAVHDIDLIRWFTDSEIVEVQPQLSNAMAEREDIALLQFRTASGVLAHINTNWLTPFKARNVTVATRGKYIMGDLLTRQVTECFGFQPDGAYSMRHLSVGYDEPLRAELLAFINAVREDKRPAVTGEEAVASLEIAIRCLDRRPAATLAPNDARAEAQGAAAGDGLKPVASSSLRRYDGPMNQHTGLKSAPIPFIDVGAQRRRLGRAIDDAIARVTAHCQFLGGPEVAAFEAALAEFCGARHAVGCASGTDALMLVLMAQQHRSRRRRDLSVVHVLRHRRGGGAGRRHAGVCRRGREHLQSRCRKPQARDRDRRAPWAQAQGRHPGRSVRPARRSRRHRGGCQGQGSVRARRRRAGVRRDLQGQGLGTLAPATATSFFPAKPLGCYGDGGAVLTDDPALVETLKSLRVHGQGTDKYDNVRIGMTSRLDTIQAAVLIEKLKIFRDEIAARDARRAPLRRRPRRRCDRAARSRRHDLGLGAIHHPRRRRPARSACGRAQGAGHSDRDLLSEAAAPAGRVQPFPRRRQRPAGHRPAGRGGHQPAHACLPGRADAGPRDRCGARRAQAVIWKASF